MHVLFLATSFGSAWWRFEGFPTAAEWAAFWGFLAAVAAAIAGLVAYHALSIARGQLGAAIESNRQLEASNRQLETSNRELVRPRVVVELVPGRMEVSDYRQSFIHQMEVVIRNIGASPARNVVFKASPIPSNRAISPGLAALFAGSNEIPILTPGTTIRHVLDQVRKNSRSFTDEQLQTNFSLAVKYAADDGHTYSETFPIDVRPLHNALHSPDRLARISKDIQSLTTTLEGVKFTVELPERDRRKPIARRRRR